MVVIMRPLYSQVTPHYNLAVRGCNMEGTMYRDDQALEGG